MQQQITDKQEWITCEDKHGEFFIFDTEFFTKEQIEGQGYFDVEVIEGYGCRLSAPGYMDCTEWTVFDTPEECQKFLDEMYPDDDYL